MAGVAAALALAVSGWASASPDPIVVCLHVPMTGVAPAPRHEDRYGQYYFDYVNEELGGVDGRPVGFRAIDDRSFPAGVRDAIEQCRRLGADLYAGWFGRQTLIEGARYADELGVPYLHGTVADALERSAWTGAIGPSDEEQMRGLASTIALNARALSGSRRPAVGIVHVDSPFYEHGRDTFRRALRRHGYRLAADVTVQKDENQFKNAYDALRAANVTVVNAFVGPTLLRKLMMSRPPEYDPAFLAIGPDVGFAATLHGMPLARLTAFHDAPVYDPDDASLPWHAQITEFQRIFDAYSPERTPPRDDLDWYLYLRARQVHAFLDALDGDTSPDNVRAMFSSYVQPREAYPSCPVDFRSSPGLGSHTWNAFAADGGAWRQAASCAGPAGADVTPTTIACADAIGSATVRCRFVDEAAGVGRFAIEAAGATAPFAGGFAGCRHGARASLPLEPGPYLVTVTARDCAGHTSTTTIVAVSPG
jgi:hypothetical protein